LDEAVKAEAFSAGQLVELLEGRARLVEEMDAEGNPIPDSFIVKVKFKDTDKQGNAVTLDLSVAEVIKRMKEKPEEFGNLFKSGVSGGLGGTAGPNPRRDNSKPPSDPAEYREWRKKGLK
jgi:hypothetical protein